MPDDPNTANPPPQPAAPAPQPDGNGSPSITPEVQALIESREKEAATKAHNAAWKQAREKYEKPGNAGQPPPIKQNDPSPAAAPPDALAILQLRDDFDDAISDLTLTGGQRKALREWVMDKRPSDVAAFVTSKVELFGIGKAAAPIPAPTIPVVASPPPAPPVPGITSRGNPPPASVPGDDVPILSMSIPEREALRQKIGDVAFAQRNENEMKTRNVRVRVL